MTDKIKYTASSGNVFADIGVARPEEANAKAELALQINELIERRSLTQAQAAKVLGINQPKVSALMRGQLGGFSIERLIRFLAALGRDVQIVVTPTVAPSDRGHLTVFAHQ